MKNILIAILVCVLNVAVYATDAVIPAVTYAGRQVGNMTTNSLTFEAKKSFNSPVRVEAIYVKYTGAIPTNLVTVVASVNGIQVSRLSADIYGSASTVLIPSGLWLRPDTEDKIIVSQSVTNAAIVVVDYAR